MAVSNRPLQSSANVKSVSNKGLGVDYRLRFQLLAIFFWLSMALIGASAVIAAPWRDIVCGPRCIQRLLEWYGKDEDLTPIIRETQGPEIRHGSSLRSLQEALNRRGIHSAAVEVPAGCRVEWRYPIILHDANISTDRDPKGHFFLWLPASGSGEASVFTAGSPNTGQSLIDGFVRSGGTALVTAPSADAQFGKAFSPRDTKRPLLFALLIVSVGALVISLRLRGVTDRRCGDRVRALFPNP
jgi:hypothetical protein